MEGPRTPAALHHPEPPLSPVLAAAATCVALFGLALTIGGLHRFGFGVDSLAYWKAWREPFYSQPPGARGAYLYSPAFAQATWPVTRMPWPVFAALWSTGVLAALTWLVWPLRWPLRLAALVALSPEVVVGNVWAFYAVALVVGFRWPQAWTLPLLTKITAAMGCVWFLARREWRPLATVLVTTAVVVAVSVAISPHLWPAWIHYLVHHRSPSWPPLLWRLPFATLLAGVGAVLGRPAWLAWAVLLGSPVFGPENFVVLAALPRLPRRI